MTIDDLRLGVVVVHYGAYEPTLRCLRSIADDVSWPKTVAVVDNGPCTGEEALLRSAPTGLEIRIVQCPENPGYGGGANRGVRALATGEDVSGWVILNHDVEILPGFFAAAARALAEPGVGAAGGPVRLDGDEGPLWYAGGRFRPFTGTVVQSRSSRDAGRPRDVGFIPGAAIAVASGAWKEVYGFDPRYFLYHEDLDLCLRLRRTGWRLRFAPGMVTIHHLGGATGSRERSALYLEQMAATRLRPHRSKLYRLYLATIHTPYVLLQSGKLLLTERRPGVLRARRLLAGHLRALRQLFD